MLVFSAREDDMETLLEFLLSTNKLPFWDLCIAIVVKGLILLSKQTIMLVPLDHFMFSILHSFLFSTQGHDAQ